VREWLAVTVAGVILYGIVYLVLWVVVDAGQHRTRKWPKK